MTSGSDLASARPRVRDDIVVGPALIRGDKHVHVIKDPVAGRLMTVGAREHFVISRLDGERSIGDVTVEYGAEFGRLLDERAWGSIMATLARRGLLEGTTPASPATAPPGPEAPPRGTLPLVRPDAWMGRAVKRVSWVFSPGFVLPALALIAGTCAVIVRNLPSLAESALGAWERPWVAVPALVLLWGVVALHELGHGLAAKRFGATVGSVGIRWRFPLLAPYCSVEEIQLLPRRHRFHIAFAGVFVSLLALPPMLPLWLAAPEGGTAHVFASILLLFGFAAAMANFVPFLRLDGYAMLNHALGTENLARDSTAHVTSSLGALLPGRERAPRPPRWVRTVYVTYAVCAALFHTALAVLVLAWWFALLEHLLGPVTALLVLAATAAVITGVYRLVSVRRRRRAAEGAAGGHQGPRTPRRHTDKEGT